MIKIIEGDFETKSILNREIQDYTDANEIVQEIKRNVLKNGDKALKEYSKKFDKCELESLTVSKEEFEEAKKNVPQSYIEIIKRAKFNIEQYHKEQLRAGFEIKKDGVVLGQKFTPIENVGVYVPGGLASYPSSVLMNIIPAQIAGVKNIIMCSPANAQGKIKDEILVVAEILGVTKIYKVGGAQAIFAMAYGTESIAKMDKIVGPGNIFVALAKKDIYGTTGIDMIAGPSEILIIADEKANYRYLSADLLSQAEHDKMATAVLITTSKELAVKVQNELEVQLSQLEREAIARPSIENNGKIIIVDSIEKAIELSNAIAPEHLEICVENPFDYLQKITNAGSIFLGENTPEPMGDYYSGTNHILPTNGVARFASAVSVDDFIKKQQYSYYTKDALAKVYEDVDAFAKSEGFTAHAKAVTIRFEK